MLQPSTLIAFGALIISAISVILNLYHAYRRRRQETIDGEAEIIKAETQMRIGSVGAAQTIIDMYGEALAELRQRVKYLEQRVHELEAENHSLRTQLNGQQH